MKTKFRIGDQVIAHPFDGKSFKGKVVDFQKVEPFLPIIKASYLKTKDGTPIKNAFDDQHLTLVKMAKKKKRKTYAARHAEAMKILSDIDKNEIKSMVQSTHNILNQKAKKQNLMHWVSALEELPENYIQVYLKITWRRKIIRQVGFFSKEKKIFLTKSGDVFLPKYVKWLKNEI